MVEDRDRMYKNLSYKEYSVFVEKSVDQVILQVDASYINTLIDLNELQLSNFEEEICIAIRIIVSKILSCCTTILHDCRDRFEMSSSNLMDLADGLEVKNFESGFNGRSFLIQFASISCIGAIFFMDGIKASPGLTKWYLINMIKNRMPVGGWDVVLEAAWECRRILRNED